MLLRHVYWSEQARDDSVVGLVDFSLPEQLKHVQLLHLSLCIVLFLIGCVRLMLRRVLLRLLKDSDISSDLCLLLKHFLEHFSLSLLNKMHLLKHQLLKWILLLAIGAILL